MQRTLLVVDDIATNREILKKILSPDYDILEAGDGAEALDIMRSRCDEISAVLLDLAMPVVDGFEVLRQMQCSEQLSHLPVIVTTGRTEEQSEVEALTLGANDYIAKPYNSTIIRQRIRNTINLRETAATVNALQRDRLTGIWNREIFFDKAAELIASREPGYYVMGSFDIENFKVINDQYGTGMGDKVLRHVAGCIERFCAKHGGICCRAMADNFAILYPGVLADSEVLREVHREMSEPPCLGRQMRIRIGRYLVTDKSLSPSAMYDRATIAESTVRGRYDAYIAMYDESMRTHILHEQRIVNEMKAALLEGQFEVWLQPQFNHSSGALIGAEALVRWRHPQRGLISPGDFIPVFERNGFIYELDKYVWEQTCVYLRKWLDAGDEPLPVSVNVSRYDIFRADLLDVVNALTAKYDIPADLLRFEVTESAFAQSTDMIIGVVDKLIANGFTIEIDDFGSGYSSLNTLKDVPADVLKLDMRFLESSANSARGGNILESIVRMAKWLNMPVIAEGVETMEQADYLKSIGCYYIQGYLYARPMPAGDYGEYAKRFSKEREMLRLETLDSLDNDTFWDPRSLETLIFNSYVGGACIFEYHNGSIELLRINDNYIRELGSGGLSPEDTHTLILSEYMDERNRALLMDNIRRAIATRQEESCEVVLSGLPGGTERTYIRTAVRVIANAGDRYLLYSSILNMTELRESEQKLERQRRELLDNLPCGAALYRLSGSKLTAEHLNKRYCELVGRDIENPSLVSTTAPVHPDDKVSMMQEVRSAIAQKRDLRCDIRILYGDTGEYRPFRAEGRVVSNSDGTYSIYVTFSQTSGGQG